MKINKDIEIGDTGKTLGNIAEWKEVSWTGVATGGAITTNIGLIDKLVCVELCSENNTWHRMPLTFFVSTSNNYLVAGYGSTTYMVTVSGVSGSGFNLSFSKSGLKLNRIFYLDI